MFGFTVLKIIKGRNEIDKTEIRFKKDIYNPLPL